MLRAATIAVNCGIVASYIAMGTNKGIADTVMLVPWMLMAGHLSGVTPLRSRSILAMVAVMLLGLAGFGVFFTNTQASRAGSSAAVGYFAATGAHADYDNFMIRNLPPLGQVGVLGINAYVTQGYYALYLCLEEPFVPTWGVGNSMFLARQVARVTGDDEIVRAPYPFRIESKGWDGFGLWSSIYPWIASDITFPGTLLIVFLIGRLFARTWIDTLQAVNPFAAVMFSQVVIMLLYFPANNQLMQSGEGLVGFWGTLVLWGRSGRKGA